MLSSVAQTYPLIGAAELERRVARAQELTALGAFDLTLKGYAGSDALGYYRNQVAKIAAEQPLGVLGSDVSAGYRIGAGDFDPTYDGKRVTNRGGEFFAAARIPLLRDADLDDRRLVLRTAALRREIADAEARDRRIRIGREATEAYWRWVAVGQRLAVVESLVELAERRQEGLDIRVQRRDVPRIEALDNQRTLASRRAMRIAAQRAVEKAAWTLSLFWRTPSIVEDPVRPERAALPTTFPAPVEPQPALVEADVTRATAQRPELIALKASREQLEYTARYWQSQRLPEADLRVEGSQDLDRDDPSITKGEFELFVGVDVAISAQNRKAVGKLMETEGKLQVLMQKTRLRKDQIRRDVLDAFSELRATQSRANVSLVAADLADQVAGGERRRFELGDSTVLILNLREVAAAEARLRVIDALTAYQIALARYRAAVGEDVLPATRRAPAPRR